MEVFTYSDVYHRPSITPGTKSRTKRRLKRKPPTAKRTKTDPTAHSATQAVSTSTSSSTLAADSSDATTSSATTPTASQKKLSYLELQPSDSDDDLPASEQGRRKALYSSVCCSTCHAGNIELKEDSSSKQGLYIAPYLYCSSCQKITPISFSVCEPRS